MSYLRRKLIGFIKIIRPINCIMMGFAVVLSMIIAYKGLYNSIVMLLGFAAAFTLTAASMAINDYFDYYVDLINAPWRPLPSGAISRREAVVYALFLTLIGLISSFFINEYCFILALAAIIISFLYSYKGKIHGLIGNFMVSFCVSLPFLYGSFAVKSRSSLLLEIFSLAAFLANTGREIAKGIVDVEGDLNRGIKTVAIIYGSRAASLLTLFFYILAVAAGFLPIAMRLVSWIYIPLYLIASCGFILDSVLLISSPSAEKARGLKNRSLIYMLIAMLAVFIGGMDLKFSYFEGGV